MAKSRTLTIPLDADIQAMSAKEAHGLYEKNLGDSSEFDRLIKERDAIQRKLVRLRTRQNMLLARALNQPSIMIDRDDMDALESEAA